MQTNPTTTDLTPQARLAQCRAKAFCADNKLALALLDTIEPWLLTAEERDCMDTWKAARRGNLAGNYGAFCWHWACCQHDCALAILGGIEATLAEVQGG